jgi:Peptidase propeptide and YPEB domain
MRRPLNHRNRVERLRVGIDALGQTTNVISSTFTLCALAVWLVSPAVAGEKLESEAKVLRTTAERIALTKTPDGKIKDAELEREGGRLIWSFDIATKGTKAITEVHVDAKTGDVLQIEREGVAGEWAETLFASAENFLSRGRNEYFILEPGYQLVLKGREDGRETTLTISVLKETKPVNGVETRVVEEREVAGGKLSEVSRNYLAIGADSRSIYYFGEDVDAYNHAGKIVHEGSWTAGRCGAKRGVLMPGRIVIGERYYQEKAPKLAMDRAENVSNNTSVKTPAGTLKHCLKVKETTPLEAGAEYKFYAPGIGLVRDGNLKLVKYGFVRN